MKPQLVAGLLFSIIVSGGAAAAALAAGWGPLAAVAAYSLAGSLTLVPGAIWAAYAPEPEPRVKRHKAVVA